MIFRDAVPLPPALHRGVVAMTQSASERTDSSAFADEMLMASHVRNVRSERTTVNNVDNVRAGVDNYLMAKTTTGMILQRFRARAGMTLDEVAADAGYKTRSGVQNYFNEVYASSLAPSVARKLATALVGRGDPPITAEEIFALVAIPEPNALVQKFEGSSLDRPRDNLEVWGSALGAAKEFDGEAIELTRLNTGDIVEYVKRPTILYGKKNAYALYVHGSSMHPALPDGEMIVAVRDAPLAIGDNVVVYLRPDNPQDDDGESSRGVLVKELVRRTASYVELRQYQPAKDFRVEMDQVLRIDRVLTRREMLS